MDPRLSCGSPREDGELEDGEICDDEAEEKQQQQQRPPQGARPGAASRKPKTSTPRSKPPGMGPGKDFRSPPPLFRQGPMMHGNFSVCPSGPDRLEPSSPRTSFWERSHRALGRLRYRGRPGENRGENRGDRARGAARGRNIHRRDSFNWKQKPVGRAAPRKPPYISSKPENGMDESFEDLLMKYKQIQLELECIRNQERRALKPSEDSPHREQEGTPTAETPPGLAEGAESDLPEIREELEERKAFQAFNLRPLRQKLLTPAERDALNTKTTQGAEQKDGEHNEENNEDVKMEVEKSPVEPTTQNDAEEEEEEEDEEEDASDLSISLSKETNRTRGKDEDDELSELQLRLLALQSASQRWQQKEQQVMKESKEKLNRAKTTPEYYRVTTRSASAGRGRPGSGLKGQEKGKPPGRLGTERGKTAPKGHPAKHTLSPVSKQAWRKQQLRTWKLQQEAQKQKSEEDEEKKKREEEIRKIRDLSNQEEQYNRFMKLVGGKHHTHIKFIDPEHRKLLLKQGLDFVGNLYQYDNYDEVAMDTDSETNSPAASPAHEPFGSVGSLYTVPASMFSLGSAPLRQGLSQYCVDPVGVVSLTPPPPPPPMPPPEESERPPKPPFADEEEEEEMMLREELLKSLANKRAVRAEDTSSNSGPPSPVRPVAPPTIRAPPTASSASLGFSTGSVLSRHSSKFARGAGASRVPLVLPRHKAVVVRLNASDDSDSELEASSSAQCVFGGLESMIKEARRTVEAARPRPVPVAEKENNPLRIPDTLPEGTVMEYRLLRAELTSRENQRIRNSDSAASSPVGFDLEVDVLGKASELGDMEEKLARHHAQLQKDQALLNQLHQQELRKKESLKLAEGKVVRLKEQLLAAEKVASANRVLLRKLQEQVQRVQHRVAVKQHQAMRMERELLCNTGAVSGNYKRNNTQLSAGKRARVDVSDSHYADLMAQKRRLQQLESEYALKIQKLKEAQALRQASAPIMPCSVTQPSLHDLTQDKLTLASDDPGDDPDTEGAEPQPADGNTSTRRRSFRESGSFTKPNLSHGETPVTPTTPTTPTTSSKQATPPAELLLFGLKVEDLRLRYQQCEMLPDLLKQELRLQGGALLNIHPSDRIIQVDSDPMAPQQVRSEQKPVPFGPYRSPLLVFRSYRFSPYFRTKEKLSLSSITYSHAIEPRKCFCRFDLTGTCNDDDCQWQHMRNCSLNGNQLFQDILSYSLPLIGCSDQSSTNDINCSTEKYIKKLFGANKDRMGSDQKAVLLVSKVNESLRHVPPFTTYKQRRKWRPEPHRTTPDQNTAAESEEENITIPSAAEEDVSVSECRLVSDVCVTQDDKRYFDSETDDISNLEYSVLDSPRDRQLWIKLAYRYLNQKDTVVSECVDAALNTLSRALEDNREDEELWCHYLTLFSRRGSTDDVREMCDMAVEHAAHYTVWWTYLSIESSFDGKDGVCKRMLQFLVDAAGSAVEELSSFHLLETLLYRAQLSVFTGRVHNARHILQGALMIEGECGVSGHLTLSHRCLAWLSYIHLCEFGMLPAHLYDPANSNPSRIVSLETFLFPWRTSEDVKTPPERLITLFQDALLRCVDEGVSPAERTLACLPLHLNLLHLYRVLGRLKEAIALCESMLDVVPHCCPLLEALSEIHAAGGDADEAVSVWLCAHRLRPHDARVFYSLCKCLHTQEKHDEMDTLFKQFVCFLVNGVEDLSPAVVLRHLLGVTSEDLRLPVPSLPEQLQEQLPYLHLIHSFWQSVRGTVVEAVEAFEAALGAISDLEVVKKLWLDYLLFTSSKLAGRDLRVFSDLVQRCLNTTPCRIRLPHHSATYWTCYSFHNQVISFYLSFLPPSLHSSALERFRHAMPNNSELCLRVLQQEWSDENVEHLKLQTRLMTAAVPTCLSAWRIAVAVQTQQKCRAEVQKLYQQALQKLPLCAALWRDWLLFEAAAGGKTDTLNKLVVKCQDVGVSLSEPLSVNSHTQDS